MKQKIGFLKNCVFRLSQKESLNRSKARIKLQSLTNSIHQQLNLHSQVLFCLMLAPWHDSHTNKDRIRQNSLHYSGSKRKNHLSEQERCALKDEGPTEQLTLAGEKSSWKLEKSEFKRRRGSIINIRPINGQMETQFKINKIRVVKWSQNFSIASANNQNGDISSVEWVTEDEGIEQVKDVNSVVSFLKNGQIFPLNLFHIWIDLIIN